MSAREDPGRPVFTGLGVALVTLFADDGALDAKATADLAARLVDLGNQSGRVDTQDAWSS